MSRNFNKIASPWRPWRKPSTVLLVYAMFSFFDTICFRLNRFLFRCFCLMLEMVNVCRKLFIVTLIRLQLNNSCRVFKRQTKKTVPYRESRRLRKVRKKILSSSSIITVPSTLGLQLLIGSLNWTEKQ